MSTWWKYEEKKYRKKNQPDRFECSGKKKAKFNRLVVFRKQTKEKYRDFWWLFGIEINVKSVNKFWTKLCAKKSNVYLVITKKRGRNKFGLRQKKNKKKTKNIRNILVIYFETEAWNNIIKTIWWNVIIKQKEIICKKKTKHVKFECVGSRLLRKKEKKKENNLALRENKWSSKYNLSKKKQKKTEKKQRRFETNIIGSI